MPSYSTGFATDDNVSGIVESRVFTDRPASFSPLQTATSRFSNLLPPSRHIARRVIFARLRGAGHEILLKSWSFATPAYLETPRNLGALLTNQHHSRPGGGPHWYARGVFWYSTIPLGHRESAFRWQSSYSNYFCFQSMAGIWSSFFSSLQSLWSPKLSESLLLWSSRSPFKGDTNPHGPPSFCGCWQLMECQGYWIYWRRLG